MTWNAAHLVVSARSDRRSTLDVHEFIYLIQADDLEQAGATLDEIGSGLEKRLALAHEKQRGSKEVLTFKYEGVRAFMKIFNPWPYSPDQDLPVSGAELTYRVYYLPRSETWNFMRGGLVHIQGME